MNIWEALILGIVQGLSEFLPISSSGHLLLLEKLGIGSESLFFNIMLHLGTLFAVLIALRKKWTPLIRHPFQKTNGYLLIACVPTVALALVFKFLLPSLIDGKFLGCGFVLTALLLFVGQNFQIAKSKVYNVKNSILTGVMQGIAVLPGVSRSGATISAMTFLGVEKQDAATFSFLLSIPIILGSTLLETVELAISKTPLQIAPVPLIVGVISAFLSGLISIKFFIKLLEKHSLTPFIVYTLLLGTVVSLLPIWGVRFV